jgi:hypothetical protein
MKFYNGAKEYIKPDPNGVTYLKIVKVMADVMSISWKKVKFKTFITYFFSE